MRTHRDAFDVEPSFPIPLFEEAVLAIEGPCGVEPTCNVEGDRSKYRSRSLHRSLHRSLLS